MHNDSWVLIDTTRKICEGKPSINLCGVNPFMVRPGGCKNTASCCKCGRVSEWLTQDIHPILGQRWPTVFDAGTTLTQNWVLAEEWLTKGGLPQGGGECMTEGGGGDA